MLYCPQCGAEYREGYSSCSDCHVLLVREQPRREMHGEVREQRAEPGDPDKDPFTEFWQGDDSRIHAELCSLLDEAEIPHITIRKEDHLFRFTTQPTLQLAVPFSQMEKAESVVRDAFGETPELNAPAAQQSEEQKEEEPNDWTKFIRDTSRKGLLPTILEKLREPRLPAEETRDAQRKSPDDWFPEDATLEIWSGQDESQADMISASLRENDIHSRRDELRDSRIVFVQPQDEQRAREIIREIQESTPSE